MRLSSKLSIMLAACALSVAPAEGQKHVTVDTIHAKASTGCDGELADAYARCYYWSTYGVLRQGAVGRIIAQEGLVTPIPLTAIVFHDSAIVYARVYERKARTGGWLMSAGLGLLAGGIAGTVAQAYCHGSCVTLRRGAYWSSLGTLLTGSWISSDGHDAMTTSLWWENQRIAAQTGVVVAQRASAR